MAFRLNDAVVCGELFNTRTNSVHGWLGLRGIERPLTFELTGNCDPDLKGRHIRFEVREPPEDDDQTAPSVESENAKLNQLGLSGLAWQQIGPTGTMTAARKVKTFDGPVEEMYIRTKLGEPPPMTWKRCLYLEWYSQNGRVVLEMVDPIIDFIDSDGKPAADPDDATTDPMAEEEWDEDREAGPPPESAGGLGITSIRLNEDGEAEVRDETPLPDEDEASCERCNDSYKLIPDELQRQLDAQAREMDRALHGSDEDDVIAECELLDDLIDRGLGEPVGTLFDGTVKVPLPDSLDDQQAECELKALLARLALQGIALHVCEHFTPRQAYRLLVENICREQTGYAELRGTGWVQNFMTSEFCDQCEAEFQREYEEMNRRMANKPPVDDAGGEPRDDDTAL